MCFTSSCSKLLERIVAQQLLDYLRAHKLLPDLQSAYRAHHSAETAVLKVLSDILSAADTGSLSMLAFDTVDHLILLRRLQTSYGLRAIVLAWLTMTIYFKGKSRTPFLSSSSLPFPHLHSPSLPFRLHSFPFLPSPSLPLEVI